jgi:hypothetical protein
MDIDEKMRSLDRTSMENICVEMYLGDGLSDGIDKQIGNRSYRQ